MKPLITATISICFLFQTGQGVANGQQLLAVDNNQLLSIDPSNGASSPIGSVVSSGTFGALAFRSDGELFGGRGFELFSINPDTGEGTLVGNSSIGTLNGFSFRDDDTLFAVSNDVLYTIDTDTGSANLIGALGLSQIEGIAFDSSGTLFGIGGNSFQLVTIDPSSGAATQVAGTSRNLSALTFDNSDTLFAIDAFNGDLVTLDPLTGEDTLVGSVGPGGGIFGGGYGGVAFSSVPEPTGLPLLIGLALSRLAKRRKHI